MYKRWSCAFLLFALGCGSTGKEEHNNTGTSPGDVFNGLEKRLLQAQAIELSFQIAAEGAFEADLRGRLEISETKEVRLNATGEFGGEPVELLLVTEGDQLKFSNGTKTLTSLQPAGLEEALLIGLTRMGILHNLARLTGPAPPDHAEGDVQEWVTVGSFAKDGADSAAISFDLTVAGEPSGSASLRIDSQGQPILRTQTVEFPTGEMRVLERYSAVTIQP